MDKSFAGYLGIDQYGNKYVLNTKHPRKELLERLNASKAEKMYIDNGKFIGYVIKGLWIALYKFYQ